ncbi:MAG: dihydroorotate dehydrogenase [Candidatus Undinarchaeales archaeon]
MTSLKTELAGVKLKNPTVLAAGILGNTKELLERVSKSGAGAVTTKSISLNPRKGNKTPNVIEIEQGLLNSMGLPNPGIDSFLAEIEGIKTDSALIVSVAGEKTKEFVKVSKKFGDVPDIIELNLSCPNVEGGMLFCQDKKLAGKVVKKVKKKTEVPVFVKLGPNVNNISEIAKAVESAGADGITAVNTMPAMAIDLETGKAIFNRKTGGLSGPALKPIALRCVYEIAKTVDIPVIGTGGISSGEDAAEMLMAGAKAVGIGTAVWNHDFDVFNKVNEELEEYMNRKRFKRLEDLVGLTIKGGK